MKRNTHPVCPRSPPHAQSWAPGRTPSCWRFSSVVPGCCRRVGFLRYPGPVRKAGPGRSAKLSGRPVRPLGRFRLQTANWASRCRQGLKNKKDKTKQNRDDGAIRARNGKEEGRGTGAGIRGQRRSIKEEGLKKTSTPGVFPKECGLPWPSRAALLLGEIKSVYSGGVSPPRLAFLRSTAASVCSASEPHRHTETCRWRHPVAGTVRCREPSVCVCDMIGRASDDGGVAKARPAPFFVVLILFVCCVHTVMKLKILDSVVHFCPTTCSDTVAAAVVKLEALPC